MRPRGQPYNNVAEIGAFDIYVAPAGPAPCADKRLNLLIPL